MHVVVDASVACKWFVDENDSGIAEQILTTEDLIIAPDLILSEVCNIFWRKVRQGQMSAEHAKEASAGLLGTISEFVPSSLLAPRAMEISLMLDHPAYDCFYMALAENRQYPLVTADERLMTLIEGSPLSLQAVSLSSYSSSSSSII